MPHAAHVREVGSAALGSASPWDEYWAHLRCHDAVFGAEATHYVAALARVVSLEPHVRVLDFGCGMGFVAGLLARRVRRVALWDRSPAMRSRAAAHVARFPHASLVDLESAPGTLPERFELVIVNSVVQYMSVAEVRDWLPRWRALLAPGGRIVLSDLLPARQFAEMPRELFDTLALQARHGLLLDAVRARAGDLVPYARARRAAPLTRLDLDALASAAEAERLEVERLPRSLTCRRGRLAIALTMR